MTFTEATEHFKMTVSDLQAMKREGLLSEPLSNKDLDNLEFLSHFWGTSYWLKRQLSRMNIKARRVLIRTAELGKVESYVFNRYYNAEIGERTSPKQVADELNRYYGVPVTAKLFKTIYAMRRKAGNARYYNRKRKALTF